jgi:hypothetical protein
MGYRIIFVDMAAGSAVSPAASTIPQVIKPWTLNVTDDEYVTVTATFAVITTGGGSVLQDLPLFITIGTNTFTVFVRPMVPTNVILKSAHTITFTAVSRAGDQVNVGLTGGLTADANTSVNVIAFKIAAESGTQQGT